MSMLSEGRPTRQEENLNMTDDAAITTHTGNRALMVDEPLIFEIGSPDRSGVDLPEAPQDCPKARWSVIIPASVARIMRLMSACSRSAAAR